MRVRQIGTLVFDADTNIVVDANNQDAPGVGFDVNTLFDPQPFSVEIAFRRPTRQQALDAVNALARELYSYAQRRQNVRIAVAGGVPVIIEDAAGGTTLRSHLHGGSVTLLSVEQTATGALARARVAGTLISPFIDYEYTQTSISSLLPYERRIVTLTGTNDAYLYKNSLIGSSISNMPGVYNALIAIEELESATSTSRIFAFNPTDVTSGIILQDWFAQWATFLRANFTSTTSGTITYLIDPGLFPNDFFRMFIEIFCPTTPPANARYSISWYGQPPITETISGDRSWYMPTMFTKLGFPVTVTVEIQNVPTGTLVMPILLIPTDGVSVWSVVSQPTLSYFHILDVQSAVFSPFRVDPTGTIYGAPGFISSRHIAVFNGLMAPSIFGASVTLIVWSHRIEPAAFA